MPHKTSRIFGPFQIKILKDLQEFCITITRIGGMFFDRHPMNFYFRIKLEKKIKYMDDEFSEDSIAVAWDFNWKT